jgi:hypothetical protein
VCETTSHHVSRPTAIETFRARVIATVKSGDSFFFGLSSVVIASNFLSRFLNSSIFSRCEACVT